MVQCTCKLLWTKASAKKKKKDRFEDTFLMMMITVSAQSQIHYTSVSLFHNKSQPVSRQLKSFDVEQRLEMSGWQSQYLNPALSEQ